MQFLVVQDRRLPLRHALCFANTNTIARIGGIKEEGFRSRVEVTKQTTQRIREAHANHYNTDAVCRTLCDEDNEQAAEAGHPGVAGNDGAGDDVGGWRAGQAVVAAIEQCNGCMGRCCRGGCCFGCFSVRICGELARATCWLAMRWW